MADFRVLRNDPNYEMELARRKHASCKFLSKLFFFVFILLLAFGVTTDSEKIILLSLIILVISVLKALHGAYVKSTYRL